MFIGPVSLHINCYIRLFKRKLTQARSSAQHTKNGMILSPVVMLDVLSTWKKNETDLIVVPIDYPLKH